MKKLQNPTALQAVRTARASALLVTSGMCGLLLGLAACGSGEAPQTSSPADPSAGLAKAAAQEPGLQPQAAAPSAPAEEHADHPGHEDHADHPGHEDHAQPTARPSAASDSFANLPSNGRLEVDPTEHDFGSAVEGEVLIHTYPMRSAGEGPLVISTAKPTCGCTVSKLEVKGDDGEWSIYEFGREIPSGTEMRLTAELNTKNKRNIASSKINIFCNDPRATVTLGLKAMLDTYFNVAPGSIDFGELSTTDTAERSFEVSGKQPGRFALMLDDRQLPPDVSIDLQPQSPDADGRSERWKVTLKLGPSSREGNIGFQVSLVSDIEIANASPGVDGKIPRYGATLMTSGRVRGMISWEPQYLSFGLVKPGQVVSRTFNVQSFDPSFEFASDLKASFVGPNQTQPEFKWADSFSSVVRPAASGKGIDVEVTLNGLPEGSDGSFQGRLVLETGHPAKPEVQVLFSGVCRGGVGSAPQGPSAPTKGE